MVTRAVTSPSRVIGVDLARGFALFGMFATHVFDTLNDNGTPTLATVTTAGRSPACFVLIAGVSLAFMSGGRTVVHGRDRIAVAAALVVRALLIEGIGLAIGFTQPSQVGVDCILPFYGLMFLLAIPLLGLPPKVLVGIAGALIALGPVLLVATADANLPGANSGDPTLSTLVHNPFLLLVQLLITGFYPVVVYMAYLCVGLAIGRLDLSSRRLAYWLLGGGLALAVTARIIAAVLLYRLGGLAQLMAQSRLDGAGNGPQNAQTLLWEPDYVKSWWYLALPSPHANTPVDLLHTLGSAMAVLGAALLLARMRAVIRFLRPVAIAGTMTLTLYCAHLLILDETGLDQGDQLRLYIVMVVGALVFAVLWRRWFAQGPLEWAVADAARRTRRTVRNRLAAQAEHSASDRAARPAGARPDRLSGKPHSEAAASSDGHRASTRHWQQAGYRSLTMGQRTYWS
jgi:uncharacterized membrane protein